MKRNISDSFRPTGHYAPWSTLAADRAIVSACGHAHLADAYYCGRTFAQIVAENIQDDWDMRIREFLTRLNGSWALVVLVGDVLYAATDRTRSYPVLYTERGGALQVTDSITKMYGSRITWSLEGAEDFLWAGYPTGATTLVACVHQIPAGMYLRYDFGTRQRVLVEYFRLVPTGEAPLSEKHLSEELSECLNGSVVRVAAASQGKIIVPLSGGMDSRVIAALLKRNGFQDVLCFAYGRKNNSESKASQEVAQALGYEWCSVEYTPEIWARCTSSCEMTDYLVFATNGCSMPVCSNWYAVKRLCESKRLRSGDVFVPGHAGMLAYASIPAYLFGKYKSVPWATIADYVTKSQFNYWPDRVPLTVRSRLLEQLRCEDGDGELTHDEANDRYAQWYWRERQAKFTVNSDRVYEYFGCQWATPLWDSSLIDFYLTLPAQSRQGRTLFLRSAVEHIFTGPLAVLADIPLAIPGGLTPRQVSACMRRSNDVQVIHRILGMLRKCMLHNCRMRSHGHALLWANSFADGRNPRHYTIRQMLETHRLDWILQRCECQSVLKYVDRPVGHIHAFGLIPLVALAHIYGAARSAEL